MLSAHRSLQRPGPRRQHGVVLVIALIVLVAMTLGGIALVRSVYSTNIIAGNLAFREAAVSSGDRAVESAIAWLKAPTSGCSDLTMDCFAAGYTSYRTDPASGQSWDDYWAALVTASQVFTLSPDAAANTVAYSIQRMCSGSGPVAGVSCSAAPGSTNDGNSQSDTRPLNSINRLYYRVTSRISGPRNTVTYVQTMIAM